MLHNYKKLFIFLLFLALSGVQSAVATCFIGIYLKFDAVECKPNCNSRIHSVQSLGEFKDPLVLALEKYNPAFEIVAQGRKLYINKYLTARENRDENARDYYTIGDIRRLYPGFLIADVELYYLPNNKKVMDLSLIDPLDGETLFIKKVETYTSDVTGDLIKPLTKKLAAEVNNYACQELPSPPKGKVYSKNVGGEYNMEK